MIPPVDGALWYLPAESAAAEQGDRPFVVIVRTPENLRRWLDDPSQGLQWIQVEGLLDDSGAWAMAAQCARDTPLDVMLSNPGAEFGSLYRLVDVRASREVRVTMPASPGFMKALRLAASLGLPVRILPGQPSPEMLKELTNALDLYLHHPMVEAPVEPFHSLLAGMQGAETVPLRMILEEEPAMFIRISDDMRPVQPSPSLSAANEASIAQCVKRDTASITKRVGECDACPWLQACGGYFKRPDRTYSCVGVKRLFACIAEAASELARDLVEYESSGLPRADHA